MAKNFLVDLNLNQNEIQNAIIQNLPANPTGVAAGFMYFNTTTNRFRVFNGTTWDEMGTGGGTVTSVGITNSSNGGLTVSGSPITSTGDITIGHTNVITPQSTQGLYPIKIDENGHITEYGTAQTINDGVLTIQKNGADIDTFSANASANKTINITVPTNNNELTNGAGYITGITSTDVTNALGYTPYDDSNPDGYITGITGSDVTTALGYTPYNSTNPNNYITGADVPNNLSFMTAYNSTTNKIATASDLAGLAGGMRFKGTIGTGGTAGADLPTTGVKIGDTYRISSRGTYDGQASNIGDLFIATSTTPDWAYIPSGNDEAVTQITAGTGLTGGTITSTGTIALDTSGVTAGTYQGLTIDAYGRVTGAVDEGYTTNTGTVTSVAIKNAVDGGLIISGSPITTNGTITIGHTNSVAAQTTQAVYPITIDDNGHISGYGSAAVLLAKYVGTITGDDSTTDFSITHNLGSRDVTIQVYDTTSYEDVIVDTERTSTNSITVSFASAPVTGKEYKVVIIG